ncbi:MAG: ketoacyl-ACP synthase III, partial [Anaerolineae bacterium]|nr:ketoacyl-ACP synthase III [Anaerolineae bacterium]
MARYAQIRSTGRYVPEKTLTNADLDRMLGEPVDQWLVDNVG